jgi:hypothetical protein
MISQKVFRFITLQERANLMIELYGQCSDEVCDELMEVADSMTGDEIDEAITYRTEMDENAY